MRVRWLSCLLCLLLAGGFLPISRAQEPEDDSGARSAFLITRKKTPQRTPGHRPVQGSIQAALGLGYTLFSRIKGAGAAAAVRVNPLQVFQGGEAVRFVLESNTDGYLYVFHIENQGDPVMLFPDIRLNGAVNRIQAHVPYELPSSKETNPQFRWFYFGAAPAVEKIFFVLTRQPLPGVPVGPELLAYCQQFPGGCPWQPPTSAWKQIESYLSIPARISQVRKFGESLKTEEVEAIDRSFGLTAANPEPSVVRMNTYATASILIAQVNLTHQ
ncbi:MAG: DUF4384 domain-containing protein [Blastocatellia bacterium]|nr:DUF4384 domain-containing protein [Blastocatellia bacterium]